MSIVAKRAVMAALTVIGLVLLGLGSWFTFHLGPSGSATFTSTPARGSVVVVEPSLLNRVDRPTTVTVTTRDDSPVFAARATPSDARAAVGGAAVTTVTGAHVRSWTLVSSQSGAGAAPALAQADIWRQSVTGNGRVQLKVSQENAPEAVVVATADGKPADISSLTVTIERRTWFFQALLVALVGLLATAAGVAGLWQRRRRGTAQGSEAPAGPRTGTDRTEPTPPTVPTRPTDPTDPTEEVSV